MSSQDIWPGKDDYSLARRQVGEKALILAIKRSDIQSVFVEYNLAVTCETVKLLRGIQVDVPAPGSELTSNQLYRNRVSHALQPGVLLSNHDFKRPPDTSLKNRYNLIFVGFKITAQYYGSLRHQPLVG